MDIDRNAARLLATMFDREYPTDQRGIGNLGRAYLEALNRIAEMEEEELPEDFFLHAKPVPSHIVEGMRKIAEMAAYGEEAKGPRSMWWWISPRALWREWRG